MENIRYITDHNGTERSQKLMNQSPGRKRSRPVQLSKEMLRELEEILAEVAKELRISPVRLVNEIMKAGHP